MFEFALDEAAPSSKGAVARDLGTFGHLPLVLGIVAFAVVAKHLVVHPSDQLALSDRVLLAASVALYVGGLLGMQWDIGRHLAPERLITVAIVALIALGAGALLPGVVVVALTVVALSAMATRSWYVFHRTEYGTRVFGGGH